MGKMFLFSAGITSHPSLPLFPFFLPSPPSLPCPSLPPSLPCPPSLPPPLPPPLPSIKLLYSQIFVQMFNVDGCPFIWIEQFVWCWGISLNLSSSVLSFTHFSFLSSIPPSLPPSLPSLPFSSLPPPFLLPFSPLTREIYVVGGTVAAKYAGPAGKGEREREGGRERGRERVREGGRQ